MADALPASQEPRRPCDTCIARNFGGDQMADLRKQATLSTFHHHLYRGCDFLCHESQAEPCAAWLKFKAARDRGERPTLQQISDAAS
jgi:hypothetical protein